MAQTPVSVTVSSGSGQTATVGTAFTSPFVVLVKDASNNPVSGVNVTFLAPGTGASVVGTNSTVQTNASGLASLSRTANTVPGTYTVTASVSGVGATANFSLTNITGAPANFAFVSGAGQSAQVGTSFANPLVMSVKDSFGNPVSGAAITLSAPGSGASATVPSTVTTNSSGLASVTCTANTVAGSYTVIATSSDLGTKVNFFLINTTGAPATVTVSSGSVQSAIVGTSFNNSLTALVKDAFNNPVPGASVTFSAPGSGASATFSGSPATTNASGLASVNCTANTVAGAYSVTASVAGAATSASFSLTNTSGAPAFLVVSSGTPQSTTVGTSFASPLVALVMDSLGNPVAGATVTFTAPGTGASITVSGGVTAATDASGFASVSCIANTVAGTYSVNAAVSTIAPVSYSLTNNPASPATVTVSSGSRQSATVGTSFGAQLKALVKDAFNNPMPGVSVTFAGPGTGASATITSSPATSDASGVASVSCTANTVAGAYSVTASVAGVAVPANFSLTNTSGAPAFLVVSSGTPQSTTVGTPFAGPLAAFVRDSLGNPVAGATVIFTAPGTGASITVSGVGTATTDASGFVSFGCTANTVAGTYLVNASVSALPPVSFSLTNNPGPAATVTVSSGSGQSASVGTTFGAQLRALVKDAFNNPLPGVSVNFSAPGSGATATVNSNPATTNSSGVASVTCTANVVAGSYSVTATAAGVSTPTSFSLTNTPGAPASVTVSSGSGQSAQIDTAFTSFLVARVEDVFNNPLPGVSVTFSAPGSGASASVTGNPATTNASGLAFVACTANTVVGAYSVTATAAGVGTPASFSLTNTGGAPASVTVFSGSGQSTQVGTAFAGSLVALVKDASNNPVPGVSVTFTAPGSGASATVIGSPATTDASGLASVTCAANTVVGGPYNVTATVVGVGTPANFSLSNTVGAPASVTVSSGSGQSTQAGTAFASSLVALVKDSFDNPVSGVSVIFTAPGSGASAAVTGSPATTNASGLASVTCTANTKAGAYSVSATVAGVGAPASFSLTNIGASDATLASLSVSGAVVMTPNFDPAVTTYNVTVRNAVTSTTLTAIPTSPGATLQQTPANPVTLGTNPVQVQIQVTAQDGVATQIYTVTVKRAAPDNKAPVVKILQPTASTVTGPFTISGTVSEAVGLASLKVRLNGVALPLDAPLASDTGTAIAWSVSGVAPENGSNAILVEALDNNGNRGTATKTVTYVNPALAARAGTYYALLVPTGTPDVETTGLVTLTVTPTGVFSGSAMLSGVKVPISGTLKNDGAARFKPALGTTLELIDKKEFDSFLGVLALNVSDSEEMSGTLSTQDSGGSVLANFTGKVAVTAATAGIYNVAFPSKTQTPLLAANLYPQGDGFARVIATSTGAVTASGSLADGTKYTMATKLRTDGSVVLFSPLYLKLGAVAGELAFTATTDSDVSGANFSWLRPARKNARYYPAGFSVEVDAVGTIYVNPASLDFGQGAADLTLGNAALVFTDGALSSTVRQSASVDPVTGKVKLIPATNTTYALSLTAGTGLFTGTFTHTDTTKNSYRGILLNKGVNKGGFGYFLSTPPEIYGGSGQSGGVSLDPDGP